MPSIPSFVDVSRDRVTRTLLRIPNSKAFPSSKIYEERCVSILTIVDLSRDRPIPDRILYKGMPCHPPLETLDNLETP